MCSTYTSNDVVCFEDSDARLFFSAGGGCQSLSISLITRSSVDIVVELRCCCIALRSSSL